MVNSIRNTVNVLESMGIEVDTVKSGVGIIRKIKSGEQYDLIITNNIYDEGRCDGEQTMQRLKEIDNFNTPIIVLTISKGQRNEFIEKGFDDYMEKILTQEQVLKVFPKHINDLKFKIEE